MKLETSDLHQALAYAVRLTLGNDSPDTQKAWLTRFNVWALYPALYPDIKHYLQRYKGLENTPLPDEHELLEQLLKAGLIATPRAVAVREHRWGREFSHLSKLYQFSLSFMPGLQGLAVGCVWKPLTLSLDAPGTLSSLLGRRVQP